MLTKTHDRIEKLELEVKELRVELEELSEKIYELSKKQLKQDRFGPVKMKEEPYSPF